MRIDIWSDVVCPFCWIGKRRFEQALAALGEHAPVVQVHWQPFQLDPDASDTPVPLRQAYAAKFGGAERTEQLLNQTQANARSEGLPMDFGRGQVKVSTFKAHRVLWLAGTLGVQDAVAEALFRAHFEHGQNLADNAVLAHAAAAGGIAPERVQAMLASDEGLDQVNAGLAQGRQLGISSVPTFVIDGRYAVQGAQPAEVFAQVLAKIAAEQDGVNVTAAPDACGEQGCDI